MQTEDFLKVIHNSKRPNAKYYIENLFPDFFELYGDRLYGDDPSVIGGIATINSIPVTVIGQLKGRTLEEHLKYNFSMSKPEGYRKIMMLMKQAEKFGRPIINFVDTLGAYPGKEAEERGQGSAIAQCLMESLNLRTPIISILIGDGCSGGALAICIADSILALEYATLSVISPKACANILWKDSQRALEAAELLKIRATDLFDLGVVNKIIKEPVGGAHNDPETMVCRIYQCLSEQVEILIKIPRRILVKRRIKKYNAIGKEFILNCR